MVMMMARRHPLYTTYIRRYGRILIGVAYKTSSKLRTPPAVSIICDFDTITLLYILLIVITINRYHNSSPKSSLGRFRLHDVALWYTHTRGLKVAVQVDMDTLRGRPRAPSRRRIRREEEHGRVVETSIVIRMWKLEDSRRRRADRQEAPFSLIKFHLQHTSNM